MMTWHLIPLHINLPNFIYPCHNSKIKNYVHFGTIEFISLLYTNLGDLYASSFELKTFLDSSFASMCHPCNLFSHIGIVIGNHTTFESVLHNFTLSHALTMDCLQEFVASYSRTLV